ncbi:MAG: glycosyltransferase family 39 protein [Deltaproteobacteria bacterium]|nr:glycosyltransferase family 39 protein [Deltaproteobacteria bacterium]
MTRWRLHAAGLVVFFLALALRVALLPTARFGGDEALFFNIGMDIVELKHWPLLGTQITDGAGRLPGPTFLYLMALPLLVHRGPEAQFLFVEVLGAITATLFWHAMRRPFGERGALYAGVLFALSPWTALYADRTWNPNVLPFVVTLALLAALRVRERPESRWLVALLPLVAVMAHLHMSAPVAWAALLVVAWPSVRRWPRRHLVIGLALCALLYLPLIGHELATGFGNTKNILAETVGAKERHPWSFLWIPVYALRFLTLDVTYHELTGYWGGPNELACLKAALVGSPPRPFHPLRALALGASIALALTAIVSALRQRNDDAAPGAARAPLSWAFAAGLVANLLLLGAAGKQVFGHYVNNLLPFVFWVYAAWGARALARPRSVGGVAALALGAIFCLGGVEATLAVSRRVDGRIGLAVHRRTLEQIRADGEAEGAPSSSVRLDFGYRSNLYDWHSYATRAMRFPIHFDKGAPRRYLLLERGRPAPAGAIAGPLDVGYADLYRLR